MPIGQLAMSMGLISRKTLDELLQAQRENYTRIGEILVECGTLSGETMENALRQFLEERKKHEGNHVP